MSTRGRKGRHFFQGYPGYAALVIVVILTLRLLSNLGVLSFDTPAEDLASSESPPGAEEEEP